MHRYVLLCRIILFASHQIPHNSYALLLISLSSQCLLTKRMIIGRFLCCNVVHVGINDGKSVQLGSVEFNGIVIAMTTNAIALNKNILINQILYDISIFTDTKHNRTPNFQREAKITGHDDSMKEDGDGQGRKKGVLGVRKTKFLKRVQEKSNCLSTKRGSNFEAHHQKLKISFLIRVLLTLLSASCVN